MNNYRIGIILVSLFVLYKMYYTSEHISNYCPILTGGQRYATQCGYYNKKYAAQLMYRLNIIGLQLRKYMEKKYYGTNTIQELMAKNIKKRYGGAMCLRETHPLNSEHDTSYTIDKGNILSLCLRSKSGDLHDFDTLKFVYLHELSHIAANVFQHGVEFWQIFKIILQEAQAAGLYTPRDYEKNPVLYCGRLTISYNPLYDNTL